MLVVSAMVVSAICTNAAICTDKVTAFLITSSNAAVERPSSSACSDPSSVSPLVASSHGSRPINVSADTPVIPRFSSRVSGLEETDSRVLRGVTVTCMPGSEGTLAISAKAGNALPVTISVPPIETTWGTTPVSRSVSGRL